MKGTRIIKNLKITALILVSLIVLILGSSCQTKNAKPDEKSEKNVNTALNSGKISGTQYYMEHELSGENGEKVVFFVKNNGKVDAEISINEENRVIKSGSEGNISVTAGKSFKKYVFRVIPTPNGGDIDISYKISQE